MNNRMNNRKSQGNFSKWMNDQPTNLTVPTRAPEYLDEAEGQRHRVGAIHYILLLAAVLFFVPTPSFADGCTSETSVVEEWGPPLYPKWIVTEDKCASASEALQACIEFIEQYGFPADEHSCGQGYQNNYQSSWLSGGALYPNNYFGAFHFPSFYVSVDPPSRCDVCLGDPVNPTNGAMFSSEMDVKGEASNSLTFKRFYNSMQLGGDLSTGWRHSFSRSIKPTYSAIHYKTYPYNDPSNNSHPFNSYLFGDEATACTSGFPQIKGRIASWGDATSSYANGLCNVIANGAVIGTVRIYSTLDAPFGDSVIIGIDAARDDGDLISFSVIGTSIVAPPNIDMTLQQTSSGYTLTDANDTVEQYDTNGKLLSITSRAGVVQTMSYDTSGRLSGVTDTFGHQLTLSYDNQNRLITVTRQ